MTRDHTPYANGGEFNAPAQYGTRVDQPVAGFYKMRLRRNSIMVGIELRYGPPLDPVTGEELDRSWRWLAFVNGEPIDFDEVFPACAGLPISEDDYRQFIARRDWARKHAPDSSYAERGRRLDPLSRSTPLPF